MRGGGVTIEDVFYTPHLSPRVAAQFPIRILAGPRAHRRRDMIGSPPDRLRDTPHRFTGEEIACREIMARIVALATAKVRSLKEARARWQEADALRRAITALMEAPNLTEMLQRISEQLHSLIPYDSASVRWSREGYLEIMGQSGLPSSTLGFRFPIPRGSPNTQFVLERGPLILPNVPAEHPVFRETPYAPIRSWMGIPRIAQDRVIGMRALDSHKPSFFCEDHLRLICPRRTRWPSCWSRRNGRRRSGSIGRSRASSTRTWRPLPIRWLTTSNSLWV